MRRVVSCSWICVFGLLLAGLVTAPGYGQERATRLLELLGKLPADAAVRSDLLQLQGADIRALCKMLAAPGTGDDVQVRYALHGMALALGDPDQASQAELFATTVGQELLGDPPPADPAFLIAQLQLVGAPAACDALGTALGEGELCGPAARALTTIGNEAAIQALRAALPHVPDPCRVAILDALAQLHVGLVDARVAELVEPGDTLPERIVERHVEPYVASPDPAVRHAALYAIASSGDPLLSDVLIKAFKTGDKTDEAEFLRLYAANLGRRPNMQAPAAELLRVLLTTQTGATRCAALATLVDVLGVGALDDLVRACSDESPELRAVATEALVGLRGREVVPTCAAAYDAAPPVGRVTILDVVRQRQDRRAMPTVLAALRDPEHDVRMAAIAAAAVLASEQTVDPLAALLSSTDDAERTEAGNALRNIPASAATVRLTQLLASAAPPVRVRLLDILGARRPIGRLQPIFDAAHDDDVAVRCAAVRALGHLAPRSAIADILALLSGAQTDDERTAVEDALVTMCQRPNRPPQALEAMVAAWPSADAVGRAVLLRVFGRVGNDQALELITAAAREPEGELRETALRALADWPDDQPMITVFELARDTQDLKLHTLAMRAFVRMIGLSATTRPTEVTLDMYSTALQIARRPDEKRLALAGLGDVPNSEALPLLLKYLDDQELSGEAAAAVVHVTESMIPARWRDARAALERVLASSPPDAVRERAEQVLERADELGSFITDWWVAGPYTQAGKAGHELFDVPFPPEEPGAQGIEWRHQPLRPELNYTWALNLSATMAGDQRAGYLFTRVFSPRTQRVRLAVGSDDGIKVWLNGAVVHANNALRGLQRDADQVEVELHEGWNTLLMKVTNDGGGWGACARFLTLDGKAVPDLRVEAGDKP